MRRAAFLAVALFVPAPAAGAATLRVDRGCYLSQQTVLPAGQQIIARGEGWAPNAAVSLTIGGAPIGVPAGTNAAGAMVHAVHALRDTVAPLTVAVPQAWKRANGDGDITDEGYGERLDKLGHLVVEMAARLRPEVEPEAQPLRASA